MVGDHALVQQPQQIVRRKFCLAIGEPAERYVGLTLGQHTTQCIIAARQSGRRYIVMAKQSAAGQQQDEWQQNEATKARTVSSARFPLPVAGFSGSAYPAQ